MASATTPTATLESLLPPDDDDKTSIVWSDPAWPFGDLTRSSALRYFELSPFYDPADCNNADARARGLDPSVEGVLRSFPPGRTEYVVAEAHEAQRLFVIRRQVRRVGVGVGGGVGASSFGPAGGVARATGYFYILYMSIYQAPTLHSVLSARLDRALYLVRGALAATERALAPLPRLLREERAAEARRRRRLGRGGGSSSRRRTRRDTAEGKAGERSMLTNGQEQQQGAAGAAEGGSRKRRRPGDEGQKNEEQEQEQEEEEGEEEEGGVAGLLMPLALPGGGDRGGEDEGDGGRGGGGGANTNNAAATPTTTTTGGGGGGGGSSGGGSGGDAGAAAPLPVSRPPVPAAEQRVWERGDALVLRALARHGDPRRWGG